jgi:cytochrome P450
MSLSLTSLSPPAVRRKRELPPTAPLPATLQTLACRRWPYAYPELCRARLGSRFTVYPVDMPPLVFLSDPQDIRAVVTAAPDVLHPGAGGDVMEPLFGESSFVLREEDEHLTGRNAITPTFHRKMVQEHAAMVADVVGSEIRSWPVDTTAFPLHSHLHKLTLRVMVTAAIGNEDSVCDELRRRMLDMLSVMASLVLQEPRLRRLPVGRGTWRRFVRRRREADELIFALIGRRRREESPDGDLLDALLRARNPDGSPLSDRQIRDSLVSVIIAGHETTAAELGWAFQLLAHNQTVQNRLVEEIERGTGHEYMDATIQQTLRHKPAFLFTAPRVIVESIEIGGWTFHPPVQLLGCTYLMHHDPELYPDPHAFRPERFLGETPQAGTWLPWGAGRKRCPGRHLALLEMRTVLRDVLSTRLVLPAGRRIEHPRWRSAILTPHAGSRVILRRR